LRGVFPNKTVLFAYNQIFAPLQVRAGYATAAVANTKINFFYLYISGQPAWFASGDCDNERTCC